MAIKRDKREQLLRLLRRAEPRSAGPTGFLSTQSCVLDANIGRGGIPGGRITVISGAEAAGKTTLLLHLVKEAQRLGGVGMIIDKEHKIDPRWAMKIGVDWDKVLLLPEEKERQYLEGILEDLVARLRIIREEQPELPVVIGLDSINSTRSKAEWEGGYEDELLADRARAYSRLLPGLVEALDGLRVFLVLVSQPRTKIGFGVYGSSVERVSGGKAPKHHASLVIDLWRAGGVIEKGEEVAQRVGARTYKNQVGGEPFKTCEFQLRYGYGIDSLESILSRALELGIVSVAKAKERKKRKQADGYEPFVEPIRKKSDETKEKSSTPVIEICDQHGVSWQCRGVWGRGGLLSLERQTPGLIQHLCDQIAQKDGWPIYNPLSGGLPPEAESQGDNDGNDAGSTRREEDSNDDPEEAARPPAEGG